MQRNDNGSLDLDFGKSSLSASIRRRRRGIFVIVVIVIAAVMTVFVRLDDGPVHTTRKSATQPERIPGAPSQ